MTPKNSTNSKSNILEEILLDDTALDDHPSPTTLQSRLTTYFSISLLFILTIFILIYVRSTNYQVILCLLVGIYMWLFLTLLLWVVRKDEKYSALHACLESNSFYIKAVLTFFLTSIFLSTSGVDEVTDASSITLWSYFVRNFPNISLGISSFILVVFLKDITISLITYKMHFSSFKDRLRENERHLKMIGILNRATGRKMYDNVEEWGRFIFRTLSKDKKGIYFSDLNFSQGVVDALIEYFARDKAITEKEVVQMYSTIIRERQNILDALSHTKDLLVKFNQIMSLFFYPLAFFIMQNIVGMNFSTVDILSHLQLFLSLKFIFESVIIEIFNSLFFIFFIRSFDIGDSLDINDKPYTVLDIGILHSEFLHRGRLVTIPNTRLMSSKIINYRLCPLKETYLIYKIKSSDVPNLLRDLKGFLKKFLRTNRKIYKDNFVINYEKGNVTTLKIRVTYKLKNHKKITEEEDLLKLMLMRFLKRNGNELIK